MESRDYAQVSTDSNDAVTDTLFQSRRGCFCFEWGSSTTQSSSAGPNWWKRIRTSDFPENSLWSREVGAFKKLREWSEIVAGPRWKTFIRRFNRSNSRRTTNYQYDSFSYSLNFDEGPGTIEDAVEEDHALRNFSVRYASIPASVKSTSIDYGKDGPSFV